MPSFPEHWLRATPLSCALLPASWLFRGAVAGRRFLYRTRLLSATRLPVPVVVVGNVMVGGTGKTPLVIALVERLREAGYRPGVITRGYGGQGRSPMLVSPDDDPGKTGDEPVLLARRAGCPVCAATDRVASAQLLLQTHPECDVLVSDDGLQHYRLARDVEISVEDGRGHGNGRMLPAGPLREPGGRRVDARVVNGEANPSRREALEAAPWFVMQVEPRGWHSVHSAAAVPQKAFEGKRLHAVAGIGDPGRFFSLLRQMGLAAVEHPFPDHHEFRARELEFPECDAVLMTEKDAVKCIRLAGKDPRPGWYALQVGARLDPSFFDLILTRLRGAHHGHAAA